MSLHGEEIIESARDVRHLEDRFDLAQLLEATSGTYLMVVAMFPVLGQSR